MRSRSESPPSSPSFGGSVGGEPGPPSGPPGSRLVAGVAQQLGAVAVRDVRQLHPVVAAAEVVVERDHLGQPGRPVVLVEGGDVGAREHEVLQRLAVDLLPVGERRLLDVAELLGQHQGLGGSAGDLVLAADQAAEAAHPRDPLVAGVPHQGDVAARPQDARELGERALVVEPVEGLRGDHHVDRAVGDGQLLGGRPGRPGVREVALEHGEHLGVGLGGVDVVAQGHQLLGELAGAGADLEHDRGVATDQPGGGFPGERRAPAVVGLDHRAEGARVAQDLVVHRSQAIGRVGVDGPPARALP